ncbi:MAG: hypothetical protein FJ202_06380 [Gemmatimonadetes bacterium]|nr:hypothetical protein [Gemmatimonadota bacterium]
MAAFATAATGAVATRASAQGAGQARPPRSDSAQRADSQARADSAKRSGAQQLPQTTIKEDFVELPMAYQRRARIKGTGKFLTNKEIMALNAPHTPMLLARVSGGDIRDIGSGNTAIVGNRGTRMSMVGSTPNQLCIIRVAINDVAMPPMYDLRAIRQEDIAAVEFYNGPSSIPLELGGTLQGDANCGLFVIWLKDYRRRR